MRAVVWILLSITVIAQAKVSILPQPQHLEESERGIDLRPSTRVVLVLSDPGEQRLKLAAESLRTKLADVGVQTAIGGGRQSGDVTIRLWDFSRNGNPPITLSLLDRETVSAKHYGQGYVLRTDGDQALWIVGGSSLGVLYGAMSALQLIERTPAGATIRRVSLRDYPDFEYRAASDWLLNIEINGWTFDRGQGVEAFAKVMKTKIDRALRYKINMALVDGFGFAVGKRPSFYPELMRRLNQYARARGIHLIHGGYGASYGMAYEPVVMYEDGVGFKGTVFENRRSYPDGPTYRCMGFPKARKGYDPAILGSCRSNDELNRRKAAELREYVAAVEPGALYIHHEDFGGFAGTEEAWRQRCERCRKRWPNDSLAAPDGGAGALAHGYTELAKAVSSVRNPGTGFDGSRDTRVILVSPVYVPGEPRSESWANVLQLWRNIGLQLPNTETIDVCFREVYPLKAGGERFTAMFQEMMQNAGLRLNTFLFFAGGADRFVTDYPLTGMPAMNGLFLGSRGIYNASGDAYQEPMELINADYSWNVRTTSRSQVPRTFDEARNNLRRFAYHMNEPVEIFGAGGVLDNALEHLYGAKSAAAMKKYYLEAADLPETAPVMENTRPMTYLPLTWDRMFAASSHWRQLIQDSKTWRGGVENEPFAAAVARAKLEQPEMHRRLARRWRMASDLNRRGSAYLQQALRAGALPESVDDLEFLMTLRRVYQPLMDSLALFHQAWYGRLIGKAVPPQPEALQLARKAQEMAEQAFPHPIDPVGGEVGTLRQLTAKLVISLREFERRPATTPAARAQQAQ